MLDFAWRFAEVGDKVLVHRVGRAVGRATPGVVAYVERSRGKTRLGIRTEDGGDSNIEWPSQQRVHPDPVDPGERCWRCDEAAGVATAATGAAEPEVDAAPDADPTGTEQTPPSAASEQTDELAVARRRRLDAGR
ncbi:MAG: hypothetical protein S0880_35695 [Actinomycetota bacterium]|nr:hypothetical protein [Actinomycetota bacterium]